MKYIYLFLCSLIFCTLNAQTPAAEVLCEVNPLWRSYPGQMSQYQLPVRQLDEHEKISFHLLSVYSWLGQKATDQLNVEQRERRAASLEQLQAYARTGLFPQNFSHPGRRPVFIDQRGVHCAVGYLIAQSGQAELSRHLSANFNYDYLADMDDTALEGWVAQSGFTKDELALIQPGYPRMVAFDSMQGGLNRPVFSISGDQQGGLLVGGLFDSAGAVSAPYFSHYINGIAGPGWLPFSAASPDGPVYDALWHQGNLYIAGHFYSIDTVSASSGVAMWDGNRWYGLGDFYHGALPDQVYTLAIFRDTLYAGGWIRSKIGAPEAFHGLAKWDGSEWRAAIQDSSHSFFGPVYSLLASDSSLMVGGHFAMSQPVKARNFFGIADSGSFVLKDSIRVPVNDLEWHEGELYAATVEHTTSPGDSGGLMVYRNQQWHRYPGLAAYGQNPISVNCLESTPLGLAFGGSFSFAPIVGQFGHNYGLLKDGYIHSIGSLDSTVNSLYYSQDKLYLGGYFEGSPVQPDHLRYITALDLRQLVSLPESLPTTMALYPNPARHHINWQSGGLKEACRLRLWSINGGLCRDFGWEQASERRLDLRGLKAGSYILSVEGASVSEHLRLLISP